MPSWVDALNDDAASRFGERLGYTFGDPALLVLALTHRSWCAEHPGAEPNERLEFLGDAVLGLVVTEHAFDRYPEMPEGELAKTRAAVVNATSLAEVAGDLALGDVLLLGKGEDASGGRAKPSILADAMEAVIGAVYVDGGTAAARELVIRLFAERVGVAAEGPGGLDFKTRLQELSARLFEQLPAYELHSSGPDHDKVFHAQVRVGGDVAGEGEGRSKKAAEQAAAEAAYRKLAGGAEPLAVTRAERPMEAGDA